MLFRVEAAIFITLILFRMKKVQIAFRQMCTAIPPFAEFCHPGFELASLPQSRSRKERSLKSAFSPNCWLRELYYLRSVALRSLDLIDKFKQLGERYALHKPFLMQSKTDIRTHKLFAIFTRLLWSRSDT